MNIGILGAGKIARSISEAISGLQKNGEDISPYAVASRDRSRAESFAKEYNFKKSYGSYEELVSDPQIDLVYIATPHSLHYVHARLAIEHGKNVLCEKPFTLNANQAQELITLARKKDVLLAEAIWTRYMPSRQTILDLINTGIIGNITSVHANLSYPLTNVERLINPELGGGALLDLGIYPLNFACMVLAGEIINITSSCTKWQTGVDAQNSITLTFKDQKMAVLHSSILAPSNCLGVITGDSGYIEVKNINNPEEIRIFDAHKKCIRTLSLTNQINGYEYEILACHRAIKNGSKECPEMPLCETLKLMKIMDDLRKSWDIVYPTES